MLPSIFNICSPRAEILSGDLKIDLFAVKLRLVVENKAHYASPVVVGQVQTLRT